MLRPRFPSDFPIEYVSAEIIRQHFNERQLYERVKAGELVERLRRNKHRNPPPAGEPFCTHSQVIYYCTQTDDVLAVVHQYLRPDGAIGGKGLPDPKALLLEDRILYVFLE